MTDSARTLYYVNQEFKSFDQLEEIPKIISSSREINFYYFSKIIDNQKKIHEFFNFFEEQLKPFVSKFNKDYSLVLDADYYEFSGRERHSAEILKEFFLNKQKGPCKIFFCLGINPYSFESIFYGIRNEFSEKQVYFEESFEKTRKDILAKTNLIPKDLAKFKQSIEEFVSE